MSSIVLFMMPPFPTLRQLAVEAVVRDYNRFRDEVTTLPDTVLFDVVIEMCNRGLHKELMQDVFIELNVLSRILRITEKRDHLLRGFQAAMDIGIRLPGEVLIDSYFQMAAKWLHLVTGGDIKPTEETAENMIQLGIRLGGFLSAAGAFGDSERVLDRCRFLCELIEEDSVRKWTWLLEIVHRLLHVQSCYWSFERGEKNFQLARKVIKNLRDLGIQMNLAGIYKVFSALRFNQSDYNLAHYWALKSLKQVTPDLPPMIAIDVMRQASKACVMKREFKRAGLLMKQVMSLSNKLGSMDDFKYAEFLLDYGYYLINSDSIRQSVVIYELALNIRLATLGTTNLLTATAHEDLAYALYVHEYNSGRFHKAREHADHALLIMNVLLPKNHLMLSSIKRVKALILEEIALDTLMYEGKQVTHDLLREAELLHTGAVTLTLEHFGETNVQTAKHFGNLGRLYQTMHRFKEAEAMHLKAIKIKEDLLGYNDYEVGLSVGHLASLYNYHMSQYDRAEPLYHRSISISIRLFGEYYSGLEYDYGGLIHLYHKMGQHEKVAEYSYRLNNWRLHRDMKAEQEDDPLDYETQPLSFQELSAQFFEKDFGD